MSAFSEQLNACVNLYVERSSGSKNALIDACQVNRSTFFQCMRGSRVPTESFFQTLLQLLQLAPGEEAKLRKLYHIAQIGENVYRSRLRVEKSLEAIATLSGEGIPQIHQFSGAAHINATCIAINGENQVFQELCYLVQAETFLEHPQIDLFLPLRSSSFFEYLKVLYRGCEGKVVRLRQLIQFSRKKEKKAEECMDFFDSILFVLASKCRGYEAYYYYAEAKPSDVIGILYPYSAKTSTGVLFINEKMDQGLFASTQEILNACQGQFEETIGKAKQFSTTIYGPEQIREAFVGFWKKNNHVWHFFSTPCIGGYLTDALLEKYHLKELHPRFSVCCRDLEQWGRYTCFCSAKGLLDFARNGIFPDVPEGTLRPLDMADRKTILEAMLYQPQENCQLYLVDENKLPLSNKYVLCISKDHQIVAYHRALPNVRIHCFKEQNLLDAFTDYFQALTTSQVILPQEEAEQALKEAIACCSQEC